MNKIVLLLVSLSVLIISCKESEPSSPSNTVISNLEPYVGNSYAIETLFDKFANSNTTGVILLSKVHKNTYVYTQENGVDIKNIYNAYESDAKASMFNTDYSPIHLPGFVVNAIALKEYADGAYHSVNTNAFNVDFNGAKNKILIEEHGDFPYYLDSVYFSNEITIVGLNLGDTLHRNAGYTYNWVGGSSNSIICFSISKNSPMDYVSPDSIKYSGMATNIDNLGYFSRTPAAMNTEMQEDGYYNIKVESYEPHIRTLSNGKQVLIIGKSSHTVTVYVTN